MSNRRVGLWLIGALGGVGSTAALGLAAVRLGLVGRTGLVTELPAFQNLGLDDYSQIVVGGHDIRSGDFAEAAQGVGSSVPVFPANLIRECHAELSEWSLNLRPGVLINCDVASGNLANRQDLGRATHPRDVIARLHHDWQDFISRNRLDAMVVINVASTEPPHHQHAAHSDLDRLQKSLTDGDASALPTSSWYAFAALAAGYPYVNFTPSTGADLPVLRQLADLNGVPVAGSDGKTGETLVKTALAPMFAQRNLRVLSWVGHNILGNRDGRILKEPENRKSKLRSKDGVVSDILGYSPESQTSIEFVESLDDWKTAWDHIHFQGFLGTRMTMQFTWQGCDSALAAPLVLDLSRLTLRAAKAGERGVLNHLDFFFKSPMSGGSHDLSAQFDRLLAHVQMLESP